MKKIFPYPVVSFFVFLMWLLLSGVEAGQFLSGFVVSVFAGLSMARLKLKKNRVRNWHLFLKLLYYVFVDIILSNISMVRIILSKRKKAGQSAFILVPLELKNSAGLAFLACILSATPGTAWISYDSKSNVLTLHVLDVVNIDEFRWCAVIKNRYEKLLLEIFQ